MSKGIELTPAQIKALQSGATMFLFFANNYRIESKFDEAIFPINKGDKDIFVQECAYQTDIGKMYYNVRSEAGSYYIPKENGTLIVASQMTKEQSRYSFNECIDAKAIRVKDITIELKIKIIGHINTNMELNKDAYNENFIYHYNQQLKEQNINRTYKDNDYVFLVEFKR